jgi:hypothetical protein
VLTQPTVRASQWERLLRSAMAGSGCARQRDGQLTSCADRDSALLRRGGQYYLANDF